MRKTFLRTPLDIFRISSGFNLRRKHPIHKMIKAHRGVDYAAPRGTPVYAAGDGKVIETGYSKANGNYIFIQHGQTYVTKYLHLNNKKVRKGASVRQKQLIGTVGSTGYATGPHLHYEFLVNGVHRNPRTVTLPQARPIPKTDRLAFDLAVSPVLVQLAEYKAARQLAIIPSNTTSAN
jgi:murein DD-endopeptidase MepM/ murein hydrolase activator NlpD